MKLLNKYKVVVAGCIILLAGLSLMLGFFLQTPIDEINRTQLELLLKKKTKTSLPTSQPINYFLLELQTYKYQKVVSHFEMLSLGA